MGIRKDEGRESLWELDPEKIYIVEGINSGLYSTIKDTNQRFALANVVIKEYDTSIRYEELPAVAFADHINAIRKKDGLEYVNLTEGKESIWIGKPEDYESVREPGVVRRSMKLFRDVDVRDELRVVEKRIRAINSLYESIKPEEVIVRLNKTTKLIDRLIEVSREFMFVPWITKTELEDRINRCQREIGVIQKRSNLKGY